MCLDSEGGGIMKTSMGLIALCALFGCATGYHARGFSGGFSESQLDDNVFTISFAGNGFTSKERATDFTLLRSAEIARQHGFGFFFIADRADLSSFSTYTSPTHSETNASATAYGNSAYGHSSTTTYGGGTTLIHKPGLSNTIVCFKNRPENAPGLVYNAKFVYESLSKKYGVNQPALVDPAEK